MGFLELLYRSLVPAGGRVKREMLTFAPPMNTTMRLHHLAIPFIAVLLGSCGGELPPGRSPEPTAPAPENHTPRLGLFALKASNGAYVSCVTTPDSAGHVALFANRPTVGPNEVFTAWYDDQGHFGFKASNGRFVCADRNFGGKLIADRDYLGEWETFDVVDAGDGRSTLKGSNGRFVGAHYEWHGAKADLLSADKPEANEWERFTVVRDPAIAQ